MNMRGTTLKMNRITGIEYLGKWARVFYTVPRGRKIYSLFVMASDVRGDYVRSFFFEGRRTDTFEGREGK